MFLSALTSWWRKRRTAPAGHLRLIMFTRKGCHLCDDAWHLLEAARQKYGFLLESVDVDREAALLEKYGGKVPVIEVNGKMRFWGRINRVLLERLLRAEGQRAERKDQTAD
ncbi:MAG: glutaredoxin family protein [Gemmataceae bacterium]|nr:glutaredoxin family protein [Gemmataceae bacterium]